MEEMSFADNPKTVHYPWIVWEWFVLIYGLIYWNYLVLKWTGLIY
jgi:hypothetical protein